MTVDKLAWFMYERNANTYSPAPGMLDQAWANPDARGSWQDEAAAILQWLGQQWGDTA